jgi:hypothetical protein
MVLSLDAACGDGLESECYERYLGDSDGMVLFDHETRLKIYLPKPKLKIP